MREMKYVVTVPFLSTKISVLLISGADNICEELAFVTHRTALWLTSIIKLYLDGGQKEEKDIDGERGKVLAGWCMRSVIVFTAFVNLLKHPYYCVIMLISDIYMSQT